jgi:hypothetical protein
MRLRPGPAGVPLRRGITVASLLLGACSGAERPGPVAPPVAPVINLRLESATFTQAVQDEAGTVPMISGTAAAINVIVARSRESVTEVPVVLRLFRGSSVVFTDSTRTGGILGPLTSATQTSAQFLIPASLVAADVSWQVELDPARTQPDSTHDDNLLPRGTPERVTTVTVPPIRLRLVPVILSRHGGVSGDVAPVNVDLYVQLLREIFPLGALSVTVGAAVTSDADFGVRPDTGAGVGFWTVVLRDLDGARTEAGAGDEYWYGVVPLVDGYRVLQYGGFGYLPDLPQNTGPFSRSSAGLGISRTYGANYARQILAHELGHNFGRRHAPGCGAVAPIDTAYPGLAGTISAKGNNVWSWANGLARGAADIDRATGDVMSYCTPVWVSPYTYTGVLAWRQAQQVAGRISTNRPGIAVP